MQAVIRTRRPEAVKEFLDKLSEPEAIQELERTYDNDSAELNESTDFEDQDELRTGMSPIMYAASTGQCAMFSAILEAMRARQLKMPLFGDACQDTVLSLAAGSGSSDTFSAVMAALEDDFNEEMHKVKEMLTKENKFTVTVLMAATGSGSEDTFAAVLEATKTHARQEVPELIASKDRDGDTLLSVACKTRNMNLCEAVLNSVKVYLEPSQVTTLLASRCSNDRSLMMRAAGSGSVDIWKAVIEALCENLESHEVTKMMTDVNRRSETLLASAAAGESNEVWEKVMIALEERAPGEVKKLMSDEATAVEVLVSAEKTCDIVKFQNVVSSLGDASALKKFLMVRISDEKSVLLRAARDGDGDFFSAMITFLKEALTPTQVREMVSSRNTAEGLLWTAIENGRAGLFRVAFALLQETLTADQVRQMLMSTTRYGDPLLLAVAEAGDVDLFEAVVSRLTRNLDPAEIGTMIRSSARANLPLLLKATWTRGVDLFGAVVSFCKKFLTPEEVEGMLMATDKYGMNVLVYVSRLGHVEFFKAMVVRLQDDLTIDQVQKLLMAADSRSDSSWAEAARSCRVGFFSAMVRCLPGLFTSKQVHKLIFSTFNDGSLVGEAFEMESSSLMEAFLDCLKHTNPLEGHEEAEDLHLHATFSKLSKISLELKGDSHRVAHDILSYLLSNYARPSPDDLINLSYSPPEASDDCFRTCCLRAVASAENPFVPGMSLSMGLADAVELAQEGEKTRLISLQKSIHKLLLKILERLPQTVRGFDGGMDGCCDVFEPEYAGSTEAATHVQGPLSLIFRKRQQMETFCNVPLLMDFLSRRFTRGLPDLSDTGGTLRDPHELCHLCEGTRVSVRANPNPNPNPKLSTESSLVLDRFSLFENIYGSDDGRELHWFHRQGQGRNGVLARMLSPRALLQGAYPTTPSLTWLPGGQFVAAGLVAKPSNYYRVPAMRMVLDLVVYIVLLVAFSLVVLFHEDGKLTWGEFIVAAYIVAGCLREGLEMRRDAGRYFEDRWNIIDVLGLLLLAAGLIFRLAANSSQWGQAFYALSAPLLFSRVLFFAQILRFQGPMIEVIFSMTAELARFGIVMGVVMVGFTVSFQALFHDDDTFTVTLLDLFKAMVGDVEYFQDFSSTRHDAAATVLLVAYLLIMTIMLLNLLVAIMSTSHARVQENAEREYRVSKARIIQRYRLVVDNHLLPAPFNLVQLVLAIPFCLADCRFGGKAHTRANKAVGRLVFWLVLGPIAVAAGALLWMTSVFTFTIAWRKYYSERIAALLLEAKSVNNKRARETILGQEKRWSRVLFMTLTHLALGLWCLVGAPLCLLSLWLRNMSCIPAGLVAGVRWMRTASKYPQQASVDAPVGNNERGEPTPIDRKKNTIDGMLKDRPGGVGAEYLRKYLEDPMTGGEVRDDEDERGVTVEHIKLLKNRLERIFEESHIATKTRLEKLEKESAENKRERADIKGMFESLLTALRDTRPELASNSNLPEEMVREWQSREFWLVTRTASLGTVASDYEID